MKKIKIGEYEFNYEDVIKTKHMRKIYPLMQDIQGNEIEAILKISKLLLIDINGNADVSKYDEIIDEMEFKDTQELMTQISQIVGGEDKKK